VQKKGLAYKQLGNRAIQQDMGKQKSLDGKDFLGNKYYKK